MDNLFFLLYLLLTSLPYFGVKLSCVCLVIAYSLPVPGVWPAASEVRADVKKTELPQIYPPRG